MALSRRRKTVLLTLLVYWPAIFIITHLPVPEWVRRGQVSDKTAHFIAYLALIFLWWFAVSPYRKVNWKKPLVWWTLLVMVWYGAFDEWLQTYVGRSANVSDFLANLAGMLTGLVLLSIFTFWPALLVITAILIFAATNLSRINLALLLPVLYATVHLFAYAFFALVWVQYLKRRRPLPPPENPKRLFTASILPLALLAAVKIFSAFLGRTFAAADITAAVAGIAAVTVTYHLTRLWRVFRRKLR